MSKVRQRGVLQGVPVLANLPLLGPGLVRVAIAFGVELSSMTGDRPYQ